MSNNLVGPQAVIEATIQVTRKATGKVEEFKLILTPIEEAPDGNDALHGSAQRSDGSSNSPD